MDKKKPNNKLIEKCEEEKEEYLNGWKRAKADLINYKRGEVARTNALLKENKKNIVMEVIAVLDSFERAAEVALKEKENPLIKGFLEIKRQMEDTLKKEGVESFSTIGKEFDPSICEIVEAVKKENCKSGEIIEELQKGYKMDGQLIRPSKVKVCL